MSINPKKLLDLQSFYQSVPYYVNKGGRDAMAELAQQYKTLSKMHHIKIPKLENLLHAHLDCVHPVSTPKHIQHLEYAALLLATKRSKQLSRQMDKMKIGSLFEDRLI